MSYGFSVFWNPLTTALKTKTGIPLPHCAGNATTFAAKLTGTGRALFATDCNWSLFDLGWTFSLFFITLSIITSVCWTSPVFISFFFFEISFL
jgi:hypothetical protein